MSEQAGPRMLMYWHGGINDYMMFKEWVPQTVGSYAGAWILFFVITVLLEALLTYRHNTELAWNQKAVAAHKDMLASEISSSTHLQTPQTKTFPWWQRSILEAIFQFLESGLAYFVMLVTMIFNIGLFFSIVLGHAVGVFFFYRFRVNPKGSNKNGGTPILAHSNNQQTHSPTPSESEEQPAGGCH